LQQALASTALQLVKLFLLAEQSLAALLQAGAPFAQACKTAARASNPSTG